jgi:hypothetical protein
MLLPMSLSFRHALRRVRYGKPIVVVSGLPRSGTSMMMQGYYELERVKTLEERDDLSWLSGARGKAVKIIAFLLRYLPEDFNYKVIFMHRDLDEVLASQAKMLALRGESLDTDDTRMRELFQNHLSRTKQLLTFRSCFEVLEVSYHEVLENADKHAERVNRFLGGRLDLERMATVVDPELYRSRR